MLTWILAALLLEPAPVANPGAPEDDIVVIGQRVRRVRLTTRRDRKTGVQSCAIKRSSGDPTIDAMMCEAVLACAPTARRASEMEACLAPRVAAIPARLAEKPGRRK